MLVKAKSLGRLSSSSTSRQHLLVKLSPASLRSGIPKDGSTYVQVLYRLDGKQSSTSYQDLASATKFQKMVDKFWASQGSGDPWYRPGVLRHDGARVDREPHQHLTGVRKSNLYDHRSYLKNEIGDVLGNLPPDRAIQRRHREVDARVVGEPRFGQDRRQQAWFPQQRSEQGHGCRPSAARARRKRVVGYSCSRPRVP
jgi:hypothetical protein